MHLLYFILVSSSGFFSPFEDTDIVGIFGILIDKCNIVTTGFTWAEFFFFFFEALNYFIEADINDDTWCEFWENAIGVNRKLDKEFFAHKLK